MRNARKNGILLNDANGELYLGVGGKMSIGNTLYQNQNIILVSRPGEIKNNPLLGIGIGDASGDETNKQIIKKTVREQYARDLLKVKTLTLDGDNILIDADYE